MKANGQGVWLGHCGVDELVDVHLKREGDCEGEVGEIHHIRYGPAGNL